MKIISAILTLINILPNIIAILPPDLDMSNLRLSYKTSSSAFVLCDSSNCDIYFNTQKSTKCNDLKDVNNTCDLWCLEHVNHTFGRIRFRANLLLRVLNSLSLTSFTEVTIMFELLMRNSFDIVVPLLKEAGIQESMKLWAQVDHENYADNHQKNYSMAFYEAFEADEFYYSDLQNAKVGLDAEHPFPVKKLVVNIGLNSGEISKLLKTNVFSLKFNEKTLNIKDLNELTEALKMNSHLSTLSFDRNNIGLESVKAIAEALKMNNHLAVLNIESNGVNNDGAEVIAVVLKTNKCLTALNLLFTNIGDDGAEAFAKSLRENTTLATLNLTGNDQISPNLLQKLKDEFGDRIVY